MLFKSNIKGKLTQLIHLALLSLILLVEVSLSAQSVSANSSPIVQTYSEGSTVYPGMLVEQESQSSAVIPLSSNDINKMLGVAVPVGGAAISLTPAASQANQILVASTGQYNVLVSDQNGPISSGDYLTISSLNGIAMSSSDNDKTIIGRAESGFNGVSNLVGSEKVKGSNGKTSTYSISSVEVNLQLGPNPLFAQSSDGLPLFIVQLAYGLANKPVNPVRIYLSAGLIIVIVAIIGSMFYGGVKSGIISIGRNPLSQKAISRGLIQTFMIGIVIFTVGIAIAYIVIVI
jgi:hypothetical protein